MSDVLMAIIGGAILIAFVIVPLGAARTPGEEHEPLTLVKWMSEAAFSVWMFNPFSIWRDVYDGYDSIGDGVIRTFASATILGSLATGLTLMGWGFVMLVRL